MGNECCTTNDTPRIANERIKTKEKEPWVEDATVRDCTSPDPKDKLSSFIE